MAVATQAFQWTEKYRVNIAELDQQHQGLFDTVNQLNAALTSGEAQAATDAILQKLLDYASTHFASEETLMSKFNYPGLPTHRAEHQAFVDRVVKLVKDYRDGKPGVPVSLMFFLQAWLKGHILHSDKAYSAFLNARGVK